MRLFALEYLKQVAPDVAEIDRARQRAVCSLGKFYILEGIMDTWLMKFWVSWMREDLIDPPPGHHIAAQEQRYTIVHIYSQRFSQTRRDPMNGQRTMKGTNIAGRRFSFVRQVIVEGFQAMQALDRFRQERGQ